MGNVMMHMGNVMTHMGNVMMHTGNVMMHMFACTLCCAGKSMVEKAKN
jgi:hypothetical protein